MSLLRITLLWTFKMGFSLLYSRGNYLVRLCNIILFHIVIPSLILTTRNLAGWKYSIDQKCLVIIMKIIALIKINSKKKNKKKNIFEIFEILNTLKRVSVIFSLLIIPHKIFTLYLWHLYYLYLLELDVRWLI